MESIEQFLSFLASHRAELLDQIVEHLGLTLISLAVASGIGISLGILISKNSRLASPVLGFVNALQTIPSVALLGFLLPFLGIGVVPAIVALFLYALLPIVRNTYTGIVEIDPAIKEAAVGMGMSPRQVLIKVEIPLAMPILFAGIRTAFVINVGVATLCSLIAAGGLGEFIFRGLSTNNQYMILAGAIPAAIMALLFDALMGYIQHHIYQLIKPLVIGIIVIFSLVTTYQLLNTNTHHQLIGGFPSEFIERGDGYVDLKETYHLDLEVKEMEIGLMYQAVKNKNVDVISGFSTDGRIEGFNLTVLEDDKNYFPPYHAAPLVRKSTLEKYPEVKDALNQLKNKITDKEMASMNFLVDEKKLDIEKVGRDFLAKKGFQISASKKGKADIIIGSKNFTESFILSHIFKLIIESYTPYTCELKLGFGGTKLLFDALNTGAVDIYPEYTGTGLLVILKPEETKDIIYEKEAVYDFVKKSFSDKYQIEWLQPLGFNNTFALMMRQQQANELGIKKISDLSDH
ncbi:ABC transporter permease/substrate-binding protein [Fulvivirga sediminis]|uniref:ABC transporter permease/substrate-binding protein n=1 Tax=Fulvivirga sediminis TaxID=2803949 RepID=A0A937F3V3_9BACT|nr:ABC transporter permease/substrate-binding protein [Fulvivirga sediminis]MBL3654526.1 ABC transporter permease/substrate-binding protein [Fulvivirga sediminis]